MTLVRTVTMTVLGSWVEFPRALLTFAAAQTLCSAQQLLCVVFNVCFVTELKSTTDADQY